MIDPFVLLTPVLLLAIFGLVRFVGCLVVPPAPGAIRIAAIPGDGKVFLSWQLDPNNPDTVQYYVKRGTSPGEAHSAAGDVPATAGVFTDHGLTNGTTYFYVVTTDPIQGSRMSNEVSAVPVPITFRQTAELVDRSNNDTDVIATVPFDNDLSPGALVVVWIWYNTAGRIVSSVSDTAGNVYQRAGTARNGPGVLVDWHQELWYARNAAPGTAVSVSALFDGPFARVKAISAHEYLGASPGDPFADPLELDSSDSGSAAVASSGTRTASGPALVFGAAIFNGLGTAGAGFTQRSNLSGYVSEDRNVVGIGQVEATFTNQDPPQPWIAHMAVFW
jgi:hypothetical protein